MSNLISITKSEYDKYVTTRDLLQSLGEPVPADIINKISQYEESFSTDIKYPIYHKLISNAKYPYTDEKRACVEETVNELLSDTPDASQPGLLLGKIQCGKTDTFETIIGLAFDRGIDVAIVLTKGVNALSDQTLSRFIGDYSRFAPSENNDPSTTIRITDIMDIDKIHGIAKSWVNKGKVVIVGKKEKANMDRLIALFAEKSEWLRDKKILIVDDEADFASRNYIAARSRGLKDAEGNPIATTEKVDLATISRQIDQLRSLPTFCRYLQVTATPYSLYMQPDRSFDVASGNAMPFRPRFTKLVPIHDGYIGGKQYYVDAHDDESMFSHLFTPISEDTVRVLNKEDRRYLRSGISSKNLAGLSKAFIGYLMATAIRRIQNRASNSHDYHSSMLIHVAIDKSNHDWQDRLLRYIMSQINDYFHLPEGTNLPLDYLVAEELYKDFSESNQKARTTGKTNLDGSISVIHDEIPSLQEIKDEVKAMFDEDEILSRIVNSDNDVNALLDRTTGQMRLDAAANIFIGGSILDRGITINNMLCFFYGRNPKSFQQDTVLQHARFYGSRSLKDMAVTRLYTTEPIYRTLEKMHHLDEQLRDFFVRKLDSVINNGIPFVGFDKNIKPCSPSKIMPERITTISAQHTYYPIGMWTGSNTEIKTSISKIDNLIMSAPGYAEHDDNNVFVISLERAREILDLITSTFRYNNDNAAQSADMKEVIGALEYSATRGDGKIFVIVRTDREQNRIRANGKWTDSPASGDDLNMARSYALNRPVLMLLRQKGQRNDIEVGVTADGTPITKNVGWNNAPFYWPVVMTPANIQRALFGTALKDDADVFTLTPYDLVPDIPRDQILAMTFAGNLIDRFGDVGTEYSEPMESYETRTIQPTTARRYLMSNPETGQLLLADGVIKGDDWADVFTRNNDHFPFILRPFKYLLLYTGRGNNPSSMLLELFPQSDWQLLPTFETDEDGMLLDRITKKPLIKVTDVLIGRDCVETDFVNQQICQWIIVYPIKKVLRFMEKTVKMNDQLKTEE